MELIGGYLEAEGGLIPVDGLESAPLPEATDLVVPSVVVPPLLSEGGATFDVAEVLTCVDPPEEVATSAVASFTTAAVGAMLPPPPNTLPSVLNAPKPLKLPPPPPPLNGDAERSAEPGLAPNAVNFGDEEENEEGFAKLLDPDHNGLEAGAGAAVDPGMYGENGVTKLLVDPFFPCCGAKIDEEGFDAPALMPKPKLAPSLLLGAPNNGGALLPPPNTIFFGIVGGDVWMKTNHNESGIGKLGGSMGMLSRSSGYRSPTRYKIAEYDTCCRLKKQIQ